MGDAIQSLGKLCLLFAPRRGDLPDHFRAPGEILARHWRRESPANVSDALRLGATLKVDSRTWLRVAGEHCDEDDDDYQAALQTIRPWMKRKRLLNVSVQFKYERPIFLQVHPRGGRTAQEQYWDAEIKVAIAGVDVARLGPGGVAAVNFGHPTLEGVLDVAPLAAVAACYRKDDCSYDEGWFVVTGGVFLGESGLAPDALLDLAKPLENRAADALRSLDEAMQLFAGVFNMLFFGTIGCARDVLAVEVVPASRVVPSKADVTYLISGTSQFLDLGIGTSGSLFYQELARSAFELELSLLQGAAAPTDPDLHFDKELLAINRLLSTYLFPDSGYELAAEVHELRELRNELDSSASELLRSSGAGSRYLLSLVVRDRSARCFRFEDIGSGFGYVLPVLVALTRPVYTSAVTFLQQPELHLHPQLQAQLGDAVLASLVADEESAPDACGEERQVIIETHSEHLLLRVLRRIRNRLVPTKAASDRSIDARDLVVLYVDPRDDGTSVVKPLRVSKQGDFMDRWPRGFFEERWRELSDE